MYHSSEESTRRMVHMNTSQLSSRRLYLQSVHDFSICRMSYNDCPVCSDIKELYKKETEQNYMLILHGIVTE